MKILLATLFIAFMAFAANAQTAEPIDVNVNELSGEVVTVRVYESLKTLNSFIQSHILICYEEQVKKISLNSDPFNKNDEDKLAENIKIITQTLSQIYSQGYKIESTTSYTLNGAVTYYIFRKE